MKTLFRMFFAFLAAVSFTVSAADGGSGSRTAAHEKGFDKNNIASVREYAEKGSPEAQYYLALHYENEKNMEEAARWYRKSAEQNDLDAQYKLGLCYDKGEGVPQNSKEAVKWYQKAAEHGIVEAQINLGVCYENGAGVEKSIPNAVEWYRKAADGRSIEAQYKLGLCYENYGEVQNYDKAAIWYRRAAERGNAGAQYKIGRLYETGQGVDRNAIEAVHWYTKAADQGNPEAQVKLGQLYESGTGVPRDMLAAVKWYRKAAIQGYGDAQFLCRLGDFFDAGNDVRRSITEATRWYRKAAELGSGEAQTKLDQYAEQQQREEAERKAEEQRQQEEAARKAAEPAKKSVDISGMKRTILLPNGLKLEMILVGAGTFEMSAKDGENHSGEIPHSVTLKHDFYIGRTEVTQAQWKSVMGNNPSRNKGDNLPVDVSWNDAMDFCEKLNLSGKAPNDWIFTLPTETQWEYAARGGKKSRGFKYCGSNNVDEVAWYLGNSGGKTHPVGMKKPNELGLYDMSGNQDEWCLDDWQSNSNKLKAEFVRGNDRGGSRVRRGGSWNASAYNCRPADRGNNTPTISSQSDLGFRLVLVPVR